MKTLRWVALVTLALGLLVSSCTNTDKTLYGSWSFKADESTDLAPWRYRTPHLDIRPEGEKGVTVINTWSHRRYGAFVDSFTVYPGEEPTTQIIQSEHFPENWYIGVLRIPNTNRTVSGEWKENDRHLIMETKELLQTSQGEITVQTRREFTLDWRGDKLTMVKNRSTRPTPVKLVFERIEPEPDDLNEQES